MIATGHDILDAEGSIGTSHRGVITGFSLILANQFDEGLFHWRAFGIARDESFDSRAGRKIPCALSEDSSGKKDQARYESFSSDHRIAGTFDNGSVILAFWLDASKRASFFGFRASAFGFRAHYFGFRHTWRNQIAQVGRNVPRFCGAPPLPRYLLESCGYGQIAK